MDLLSSPASHSETTANTPTLDFKIIAEIPKSLEDLKELKETIWKMKPFKRMQEI